MPKSLVLSNGHLLVNLDKSLLMSDFYYPHVGMEDHTTFKHLHRIGVYVDGKFSWLCDDGWESHVNYHHDSLVGNSTAENKILKIKLLFEDFVAVEEDIFVRRVTVENHSDNEREIKLYFHSDFHLYGEKMQDTAEYEPFFKGVLHYRKKRYFLISGQWENSGKGISGFATGKSQYMGKEGTWRDAEDGKLGGNPIEQGSVDSTIEFKDEFFQGEKKVLNVFVMAGVSYGSIQRLYNLYYRQGAESLFHRTLAYWQHWSNKQMFDFSNLSIKVVDLFKRSLLIVKSQIDYTGAIIAANDSDIIKFNKDTYTYMWPRDGALAVLAMNRSLYADTAKQFFNFCKDLLTDEGYMMHKYNPDGSIGSSWHPKFQHGEIQLPIQEDETALPIFALNDFFKVFDALEYVNELYEPFIKRAARFIMNYVDKSTGLPLPSYDLWEEHRGVFSYTVATVYGGMNAAANLAESIGNDQEAEIFHLFARRIKETALKYLYSEEHHRFLKSVTFGDDNVLEENATVDASLSFVWRMGLLPANDPRVISTMKAIYDTLWVKGPIGGLARYENDYYQREFASEKHPEIIGNPWIVTTLWYALWKIEIAKKEEDLQEVIKFLDWVVDRTNEAGILPEQVDPFDGRSLSVAPLTWSHAEFVLTVLAFQKKLKSFNTKDL